MHKVSVDNHTHSQTNQTVIIIVGHRQR